ncbi:MAG: tetratricopeptide repeat protein [Thermoplasmata archaeon]
MMRSRRTDLEDILKLLETCQKRLRMDPGDLDAWFSKGVALAKLKEYRQAIYCFNQVTRIQMNYPSVWRLKATVYVLMGEQRMSRLCKEVAKRLQAQESINSFERIPAVRAA